MRLAGRNTGDAQHPKGEANENTIKRPSVATTAGAPARALTRMVDQNGCRVHIVAIDNAL
jgi:hypothetical protein